MKNDPALAGGNLVLDWAASGNPNAFFIRHIDPITGATRFMAEAEVGRKQNIPVGVGFTAKGDLVECWYGVTPTEAAPKLDLVDRIRRMWGKFPRRHIHLEYTHAVICPCTLDRADPHYGARKALYIAKLKAENNLDGR